MKISLTFIAYFQVKYANGWADMTAPLNTSQRKRIQNSYIEHCGPGHWNEFPSCEGEFLAGHGSDEDETALERDRHPHPFTPPRRIPHALCLKHFVFVFKIEFNNLCLRY
jgi:hypothetical protein